MSTENEPVEIQEGLTDVVVDERSGIRMSNLCGSPENGLSAAVRTFGCLYNGAFEGVTKEASVQKLYKAKRLYLILRIKNRLGRFALQARTDMEW
jgi:hypothetical protein